MMRYADFGNKATATTETGVNFNIRRNSWVPNHAGVITVLLRWRVARKEDAPAAGVAERVMALSRRTRCNPVMIDLSASNGLDPAGARGRTARGLTDHPLRRIL
jgi:hypothetical protein